MDFLSKTLLSGGLNMYIIYVKEAHIVQLKSLITDKIYSNSRSLGY
jgi:hypothetical protein